MQQRFKILRQLSDGRFHSGSELGETLGISRAAVWKHLVALNELDIDIHAVRGRGYQLAQPLELLSKEHILSAMDDNVKKSLSVLEVFDVIDSTNSYLMQEAVNGSPSGHVCLAESQHAGRGRRGKRWISPYARNIYASVLWHFPTGPDSLAGLGLAVGVGIIRTLSQYGINDAGLKWPNDVIWNGAKLGGVLLEMTGISASNCSVVVGVGLNVTMSGSVVEEIDQSWTDIATILGDKVSRNDISASLIQNILKVLSAYETHGLEPFLAEWREHDMVTGRQVTVQLHDSELSGVGQGIDDKGALVVKSNNAMYRFLSGEVSLQVTR
jgi:BirA family biotin operon repressor/biotin-[acetyl-CoA-carboxylase] ligase